MGLFLLIHSATLRLLIGALSRFIFKVIIDMYVLTAILCFLVVFVTFWFLSSCFVLFPCDLMTIFNVMFGSLSLFVCVYLFWFVVTTRFVYNNIYICMIYLKFMIS